MNNSFSNFCNIFYNSTFIPIHCFDKSGLVLQLPKNEHFQTIIENKLPQLLSTENTAAYFETNEFNYIGIIKSKTTEGYVIVGPVLSCVCTKNKVKEIMIEASIQHERFEEINDLFQLFPVSSFFQFLNVLILINYELNGEFISVNQIIDIENAVVKKPVDNFETVSSYNAKESQSFHNTHQLERKLLKYIEHGDPEAIRKYLENPAFIKAGVIAENNLRNIKNLFIVTVTLVTRSAIKGGLDIEVAYNLSDAYIFQMERLQSMDTVYQLQYAMLMDFAKRVSAAKIPEGISGDIFECIQFISRNTNRSITVSDVAEHLGKSRSHISHKFKAEMGFDLSAFIMRKKLEEAKSLLSFTDKTISEISYYLCFSTQSYFQNVFRKKFGLTPNEYRNLSKR